MAERKPVLVVGGGPTGATIAMELSRLGVPVRIVDKARTPARHRARWRCMLGAVSLGTVTLASGAATFQDASVIAGAHAFKAIYSGDTDFAGSTSAIVDASVGPSLDLGGASTHAGEWFAGMLLLACLYVVRRRLRA